MDKMISFMDTMLEDEMTEHNNILTNEMKAILEKETGTLNTHYDREIEGLKGEVHILSVQNKSHSEKVDKLWSERQATMDNIYNVWVAIVFTAQYTRRATIIVDGVPEAAGNDQEDCNNVLRSLIKEKTQSWFTTLWHRAMSSSRGTHTQQKATHSRKISIPW